MPTPQKEILIATQGFAALTAWHRLHRSQGFLFKPGGRSTKRPRRITGRMAPLPTDGSHAIDRTGAIVVAAPMKFDGADSARECRAAGQAGDG